MARGWFPKANTSDHYVFLTSLEGDNPGLYTAAAEMLKVNGGLEVFAEEAHFENALAFLNSAANAERIKEINFLRSKGLEVDLNTDFIKLIELISSAILGVEEFQRRVKEEISRRGKRGTGSHSYTQALGSYIESALNQLQNKGRTKNTLAAIVRKELIESTKFLSGELNIAEIAAVIGAAQSQIMGALQEEIDKDTSKSLYYQKDKTRLSVTKVRELIRQNPIYQANFGAQAQKTVSEFQMIANNILSKYKKVLSPQAENALQKKLGKDFVIEPDVNLNEIGFNEKKISELTGIDANNLYTYSFKRNTGMGGEARIYQDLSGLITSWIGGSGGKADTLSYTIGEVEVTEKQREKIDSSIQNIINNISAKTQSDFDKVNKNIAQNYENLEQTLKEISKELGELKKCFILHSNVKDYFSTATSDFKGFEGGTYQGLSIIDALSALSGVGFPMGEIDWLKTCLVNTASSSIGAGNKSNLEKYFSIFATMLLFDDGATIAEEVTKNLPLSSLNVLHLFPVNGIYVPSSYVMSTIAIHLQNWFQNNVSDKESQSVSTTISPGSIDFSAALSSLTEQEVWNAARWRAIRDQQISAMSVRIRFLANFRSLILNI